MRREMGGGEERERGECAYKEVYVLGGVYRLYREEPLEKGQPSPWDGKFKVEDRICQVGIEGCWETWKPGLLGSEGLCVPFASDKENESF